MTKREAHTFWQYCPRRSQRQTRNALRLGIVHRYVVQKWLHYTETETGPALSDEHLNSQSDWSR